MSHHVGTNGLVVHPNPCWPSTSGDLSLQSFKDWMQKDNETLQKVSANLKVKNEYLVIGGVALGAIGLAYYGHKKRWF